ncbi:MAG TPA: amidohydrolase family protein [Stellaceae bacterium]|nr:amidohydrolase family protein [Stellaceae bacterium]
MTDHGKIIDLRCRPPAAGFETMALYWDKDRVAQMGRDIGFEPAPSYLSESVDDCIAEMDEAGIGVGVVTGRLSGQRLGRVENAAIIELVRAHPGRFWGMAGIDLDDMAAARRQVEEAIGSPHLCGAVFESGCAENPRYTDDPAFAPLFGACEDAGLPVLLMAGGNAGPDLSYSSPVHLDRLAARHPKLQIVAAHGSWPWVNEILGVAYRRKNVWVSPDMYIFLPGGQMYVEAANTYLQDRFLFGTAYPALPFGATVAHFLQLPFREAVHSKVLHENARRLLGAGA